MKEYQRQDGVMYLYDGDEKRVLVFPLIPKKEEFYNYKKSELETIPEDRRRLQAEGSSRLQAEGSRRQKILEEGCLPYLKYRKSKFFSSELFYSHYGIDYRTVYHKISPISKYDLEYFLRKGLIDENLIEVYCQKLGVSNYVEIADSNELKINAMILGESRYKDSPFAGSDIIKTDIINIPISLLRLEQFMDGCFEELDDEQIKEYLKLYEQVDINNPVYVKELSDVDEMTKYFPQIVIRRPTIELGIKNDAKVLSLLKKRR